MCAPMTPPEDSPVEDVMDDDEDSHLKEVMKLRTEERTSMQTEGKYHVHVSNGLDLFL